MTVEERLDALEEAVAELQAAIAANPPAELSGMLLNLAQQSIQSLTRTASGAVVIGTDVARATAEGIL